MDMSEALEWAADYAERAKIFEPPIKANGYVSDGWKPSTPAERTDIIIKLAREAVRGERPHGATRSGGRSAIPDDEGDDDTPF